MERGRNYGRGWGGWYHPHPQLTPAQQTARTAAVNAERTLDDQIRSWEAAVHAAIESAAQNGAAAALPPLPSTLADAFKAEVMAKDAVKVADAAAADAATAASTATTAASPSAAATP